MYSNRINGLNPLDRVYDQAISIQLSIFQLWAPIPMPQNLNRLSQVAKLACTIIDSLSKFYRVQNITWVKDICTVCMHIIVLLFVGLLAVS